MALSEKQMQMVEKVLKLLELGDSNKGGTEAERETANRMAAKLMADYSLDFADLRTGNKMNKSAFKKFDLYQENDDERWENSLANVICHAFDVKLVQSSCPKRLMFCGIPSDIDICMFFFKYLRRAVGMQSMRAFTKKADRETFAFGMIDTIGKRLSDLYKKRNEAMSSDSRALMVVKQDGLQEFMKEQFPNLRKGRSFKLNGSRDAYGAGSEAGKKVNISRPLGGSNGTSTAQIK